MVSIVNKIVFVGSFLMISAYTLCGKPVDGIPTKKVEPSKQVSHPQSASGQQAPKKAPNPAGNTTYGLGGVVHRGQSNVWPGH